MSGMRSVVDLVAIRQVMADVARERHSWLTWPLGIALVAIPIVMVASIPGRHLLGCLLAYANLLLLSRAVVHFARLKSLQGLLILMFLAWFMFGFILAPIYFAITYADASYSIAGSNRGYLDNNARVQLAVLLFFVPYLTIVTLGVRTRNTIYAMAINLRSDQRLARGVFGITAVVIGLHALTRVVEIPPIMYFVHGVYNYLWGLPLVLGALFTRVSRTFRLVMLVFLVLVIAFYLVGNARGWALFPFMMFCAGFLFCSRATTKQKWILVLIVTVAFPILVVVGNTTREVLGGVGFENFASRVQILSEWQAVEREGTFLGRTFARLFSTGAHSIIAYTPEQYNYVEFSPGRYVSEFVIRMFVPGRIYDPSFYSTTFQLRNWGFNITEEHSVELTMLGALYMVGGLVPVFIGGVLIGLVHVLVMRYIDRVQGHSMHAALFLAAALAPTLLNGRGADPISHVRTLVWQIVGVSILYFILLRAYVGRGAATQRK